MYGTNFYTYELTGGWTYEGRNRALFPDRGMQVTHLGAATRCP